MAILLTHSPYKFHPMNHFHNWKLFSEPVIVITFLIAFLPMSGVIGAEDFRIYDEERQLIAKNITILNQDNELLTWEGGIDFNKNYVLKVSVGEEFRITKMLVKLVRGTEQIAELKLNSGTADIKKWSGQLLPGSYVIIQILNVSKVDKSVETEIVSVFETLRIPVIASR